jgi:hypothetical protein
MRNSGSFDELCGGAANCGSSQRGAIDLEVRGASEGQCVRYDLRAGGLRTIAAGEAQISLWQVDGASEVLCGAPGEVKCGPGRHLAIAVHNDALRRSRGWRRQIYDRIAADRGSSPTAPRTGKDECNTRPGNGRVAGHVQIGPIQVINPGA